MKTTVDATLIIPTYNEGTGIITLLEKIMNLDILPNKIIVSDDSTDETTSLLKKWAQLYPQVWIDHHPVRLGLIGSVLKAMDSVSTSWVVVMDGDGQHPPAALSQLLHLCRPPYDLVLPTRAKRSGRILGMSWSRSLLSVLTRWPARLLLPPIRHVADPLGGIFACRREFLLQKAGKGGGWKILLEILTRSPWKNAATFQYCFQPRRQGSSKIGLKVGLFYLWQLLTLIPAGYRNHVPGRKIYITKVSLPEQSSL